MEQNTAAQQARYQATVATAQQQHGWDLTPRDLGALERETEEKLVGRTGGAVTLAVGMAKVFAALPGMSALLSYWYHFVIMFEALFILTLLETGTRVARFVVQEAVALLKDRPAATGQPNWTMNIVMSVIACGAWGFLLFIGNISVLWRILGIANQLLATIGLAVGTSYLLQKAPRKAYALCTGIPFVFVVVTVFTAGIQSVRGWWAQIPNTPPGDVFLLKLACALAAVMLALTGVIVVDAARRWTSLLLARPTLQARHSRSLG